MSAKDLSRALVAAVADAGVDRVFGMPGGGNNLDFIAAAESAGLSFVLGHHETSSAIMASVYGELTCAPGVCVVTRGPGSANAVNGAANATLDRQALVLITDVVSSADASRIAHQRIDQRALFAPVTKASATVGLREHTREGRAEPESGSPCDETIAAAVAASRMHPRGAVHLDFDPAAKSTPISAVTKQPSEVTSLLTAAGSGSPRLQHIIERIASAKRPVVVLGVGARGHVEAVRSLLADSPTPVLMTYRAKGVVPDSWACNAGLFTGATTEAPVLEAADLIVLIGMDSVELIPGEWPYTAPVVSVAAWHDPSPYLEHEAEVIGDLDDLLLGLRAHWPHTTWPTDYGSTHRDRELDTLRRAGVDSNELAPQQVVTRARAAAAAGSIATIDAGAHMFPSTTLWYVEHPDEMLISSGLATMGFALPAAVAAALAKPDRQVVCFTGDGGLGMCLGELETLARLHLNVTVIVFNDAALSLIAIKADPAEHAEENAVAYSRTDFARVAEGYGMPGFRVDSAEQLDAALNAAFSMSGPALIDAAVDPRGYPSILAAVRGPRPSDSIDRQ